MLELNWRRIALIIATELCITAILIGWWFRPGPYFFEKVHFVNEDRIICVEKSTGETKSVFP